MKANLIAVQARTELADYRSGEAFHAKMASLMQAATCLALVDCGEERKPCR